MYSYEERLRAVQLFLRTGKNCKATIRQLGYPTKNALKAWCANFEQNGDVLKRYQRTKPKYSEEQKKTAVSHFIANGRCIAATIRSLGYQKSLPIRDPSLAVEGDECYITYITSHCHEVADMSIGSSGRIVIEIDPDLKRGLYSNLTAKGLTLKEWFVSQAQGFIAHSGQIPLPMDDFTDENKSISNKE